MEDVREDFLLADAKVHVVVVRMRADVNDAVHVEIEIVENGNLKKGSSSGVLATRFVDVVPDARERFGSSRDSVR